MSDTTLTYESVKSHIPELSPMMQTYLETKSEYTDCILFYRLGDFYEMFFDDALEASRVLEITLTGKNCGIEERAPMCGVPFHAVESYLGRLVNHGYKVAICEQVEDPKLAKGLVKREVVRIVTPGTNPIVESLDSKRNNYIVSVLYMDNCIGFSYADVTTGDYYLTELDSLSKLYDEISKFSPSEIICNEAFLFSGFKLDDIKEKYNTAVSVVDERLFDEEHAKKIILKHFKVSSLIGMGVADFLTGVCAAGALLDYLYETQKNDLVQITHLYPYSISKYMLIDSATRRNLELTETMRDKLKVGSLLWVLDLTKTAMGGRLLRRFIEQPLIETDEINRRLDIVDELSANGIERDELREYLGSIYDIERLIAKISLGTINPRDMLALKSSMQYLPAIKNQIYEMHAAISEDIYNMLDTLEDLHKLIDDAIEDEPPLTVHEGGIFKTGYDPDIDTLRSAKTDGRKWLAELEESDRERTGIKNLKIKYNKVFGYYFEVTNSYADKVPEDYIRKQTLTGSERYTNQRLKELEDTILNAQDKLYTLEYDLFTELKGTLIDNISRMQQTAGAVALLDVYCSLSLCAERNHYVRPEVSDDGVIDIKEGRHPVIEKIHRDVPFVSNDTYLDRNKRSVSIITGPNMAGKSTYMRQTALIVLMAQMGSYVPASSAHIGITDRIFTRVGASDDLASGQSTFMVEMNEVANILRNATSNSLLILDEIGRGTSTFDGMSIAWAVIEHISNKRLLGARTLFATHYHELTELEGRIDNVNNYCIAVKEQGDSIVFLRKIVKGGADRSYGILVAKLAGVPDMVIDRAKEISAQLSENDIAEKLKSIEPGDTGKADKASAHHYDEVDLGQMSLFATTDDDTVLKELEEVDITALTPIDALNELYRLQNMLKNRWKG